MKLMLGDCLTILKAMPEASVQTCITSPPYWGLRDYGVDGQLGLEKTPEEYVANMVAVFKEVKRVLKDNGTLWLNLGDSYANSGGKTQPHRDTNGGFSGATGSRTQAYAMAGGNFERPNSIGNGLKPKDLVGIPWRVAFALQADGWYLRQDIIWHKPNPMPESVTDRCTKAHEYIFLLSKSPKYFFDSSALKEPAKVPAGPGNKKPHVIPGQRDGENSNLGGSIHKIGPRLTRHKRSVWTVTTKPFKGAHFATFPVDLIEPCILAGSAKGDIVLDPFNGAGTTGVASLKNERDYIGIELNPEYLAITEKRLSTYLPTNELADLLA